MNHPNHRLSLFIAMVSVLCANALLILALVFVLLASGVSLYSPTAPRIAMIIAFVVTQILCLYVLRRRYIQQGRTGSAKGLVMGAVITALINGSCFISTIPSG